MTQERPVDRVLGSLKGVKQTGSLGQWTARCPVHDDRHNSLAVKEKPDGTVLLNCFSGCTTESIVHHLGLKMRDLFPTSNESGVAIVKEYLYRDENNKVLYKVVRYLDANGEKGFYQKASDGKGGWKRKLGKVKYVPFHLPETIARSKEPLFIVEGEKDAETLMGKGILATTSSGGARREPKEFLKYFKGRDEIVILPDNDTPGKRYAANAATILHGNVGSIKIVSLPGLGEHGDVSDYFDEGNSLGNFRKLVAAAPEWKPGEGPFAKYEGQGGAGPEAPSGGRESDVAIALDTARMSARVICAPNRVSFAVIEQSRGRRVLELEGKHFKKWLAHTVNELTGRTPGKTALETAISILAGSAESHWPENECELFVRSGKHENALYLDLNGDDAVKIEDGEWEVIKKPPVYFRTFPEQKALPIPVKGGDVREILEFVNVTDSDEQILLISLLVVGLIPGISTPAIMVSGPQGSAKSTLLKYIKALLDPNEFEVHGGLPKKPDGIVIAASQNRLVNYDNLSKLSQETSDLLCCLVTGGAYGARTLFTNEDFTVIKFHTMLGLTGINLVAKSADLLDRSLFFRLSEIPDDRRRGDGELKEAFEEARPRILGAMLDALAKAIEEKSNVKVQNPTRMLEFQEYAVAAAIATGTSQERFEEAMLRNTSLQHDVTLDASPVAQAVIRLMRGRPVSQPVEWNPAALFGELRDVAFRSDIDMRDEDWPGGSNKLKPELERLAPSLRANSIDYQFKRTGRGRFMTLTNMKSHIHPLDHGKGGVSLVTAG